MKKDNQEALIDGSLHKYFHDSSKAIKAINNNLDVIKRMTLGIFYSQLKGGILLIGGNGGSSADAQHFAGEMTCTYKDPNRKAFSAISLTTNASAITAWANDFGFDSFFTRQVEAHGKPGDILFLNCHNFIYSIFVRQSLRVCIIPPYYPGGSAVWVDLLKLTRR